MSKLFTDTEIIPRHTLWVLTTSVYQDKGKSPEHIHTCLHAYKAAARLREKILPQLLVGHVKLSTGFLYIYIYVIYFITCVYVYITYVYV